MLPQETEPHEHVANPRFNHIFFGLVGGLAGAVIMGLVAYITPPPTTGSNPFFIAAAATLGAGRLAWAVGWLLNVCVGMAIGAVFGVVVTRGSLARRNLGNKMLFGVVIGLVAWVVLFVPLMVILTPSSPSADAIGSGLVFNVTFGVVLAVVFVVGQSFMMVDRVEVAHVCDVCGEAFPTNDGLQRHRDTKHPTREQLEAARPIAQSTANAID
jgi:hypothetical protein